MRMPLPDPESAVAEARELYRCLMDAVRDAILIFDFQSLHILDANKYATEIYGYSREELLGKEMGELTREVPDCSDLLRGARSMERTDFNKSGGRIEFLVSLRLIDYGGRKAVLSINRNLREQKEIASAIGSAEKKCRALMLNISEIVALLDREATIIQVGPQVQGVLGLFPEELRGQRALDFIHPGDRHWAIRKYTVILGTDGPSVPFVLRFRHREGHWIPLEVIANNRLRDPQIAAVIFTARDLRLRREAGRAIRESDVDFERNTKERANELARANAALRIENQRRRRTEARLQQSLSLFHAALESTADGILVVSREGVISGYNEKFMEMWRIPRMNLHGKRDEDVIQIAFAQLPDPAGFLKGVQALYSEPEAVSFDAIFLKDGRILERYSQPQRVGDQIVGRVWSFRDVTQTRQLEEELRQGQKMEAVGRLAGGIAHDFNNLLMLISGYANQILDDKTLPAQHRRAGEQLLEAAGRAALFTRQLMAFSRKNRVLPVVVDLNRVVAGMETILERLVSGRIQLVIHLLDEPLPVYADPSRIELMVMNLAINARDAMADGGVLTLTTSRVAAGGASGTETEGPPTEHVLLQVTDTGCGMTDDIKPHIFEPFFTTKERGKGTGLGLSTVYGIVEQAKGYISVESVPNEGSAFRIFLPRSREVISEEHKAEELPPAPGHETVLLVEDETGIRAMTRVYLESLGYKVLEAANGREAAQISRQYQTEIELLLTDVVMPGLRGDELARLLSRERPGIGVIYISGYADSKEPDPGAIVLEKPFTFPELGRTVRVLLDQLQEGRRGKPLPKRSA